MADVAIDAALVGALLHEQHQDLAHLPLSEVGCGWDNRLFRLGGDLLARLPCREMSAPLVEHERRWLATLAPRLPVPIPVPLREGRPGCGYPWAWSVVPWLAGETLLRTVPADPSGIARDLAAFLRALHQPAPAEAPANPWRGIPLATRSPTFHSHLERFAGSIDRAAALAVWQEAVAAPPWPGPAVWIHGDVHPGNLLVAGERLSAVIDFGDVTSGDPATDFAIAWMLPRPAREALISAAGEWADETLWCRARAWALSLGLSYVNGSQDGDPMIALGRTAIAAALGASD